MAAGRTDPALIKELLGAKGLLLRAGTVVDATLIAAPSSTKNASSERDPQTKKSQKGQQWYFGMKAVAHAVCAVNLWLVRRTLVGTLSLSAPANGRIAEQQVRKGRNVAASRVKMQNGSIRLHQQILKLNCADGMGASLL